MSTYETPVEAAAAASEFCSQRLKMLVAERTRLAQQLGEIERTIAAAAKALKEACKAQLEADKRDPIGAEARRRIAAMKAEAEARKKAEEKEAAVLAAMEKILAAETTA